MLQSLVEFMIDPVELSALPALLQVPAEFDPQRYESAGAAPEEVR